MTMKRRPFLKSLAGWAIGVLGLGGTAKASQTTQSDTDITIGDLFWDEHHVWCDGCDTIDVVNLVLSADMEDGVYYYRLATFSWCPSVGYCGALDRKFERHDVLKMTKVGNIVSIKSFG